eukprot:4290570-Prorocentrum_lima.AAC.1
MLTERGVRCPCEARLPSCEATHLGMRWVLKAHPGSAVPGSGAEPWVLLRQHGHVRGEVGLARATTVQVGKARLGP